MSFNQNLKHVCNKYMKHNCNFNNCKFIHDPDLCKFFYNGNCTKPQCKFNHFINPIILQNYYNHNTNHNNNSNNYINHNTNNNINNNNQNPIKTTSPPKSSSSPDKTSSDEYDNVVNIAKIDPNKQKRKRDKSKYNNRKSNTETFEPNYSPADMRVLLDIGREKTNLSIKTQDIILAPNLFCETSDFSIYNNLLAEMNNCGIEKDKLFKLWHGDTHFIADDHLGWNKDKSKHPTFNMIIDKISSFFNMDIKATRFNWYSNDNEWKPKHHDAAAVKADKAKTQNFTVGVSFGKTRDIEFEDALEPQGHRRVVNFPLPNGYTYCFTRDINVNWRHGVSPIHPDKQSKDKNDIGRISIIAWGYVKQEEAK